MDQLLTIQSAIEIISIIVPLIFSPISTIVLILLCLGVFSFFKFYLRQKPQRITRETMQSAYYTLNNQMQIALSNNISIPSINNTDVFVAVRSAAINPIDYKLNTAKFPFYRWATPNTVGLDFAGVVLDVGSKVSQFKIGDKVFGNAYGGSLQEYSICRTNNIAHMPDNFTFDEAACLGVVGGTALQSLRFFADIPTQDILIIGASGGVGSIAIQIAEYYKTKIIYGVCSKKNIEYVQSLCPTAKVIDYTENIDTQIGEQRFDLIFDTVSSPEDENQELIYGKYLRSTGNYVCINGLFGFIGGFITSTWCNWRWLEPSRHHLHCLVWNNKDLQTISTMANEGKLKMRNESYPLTQENLNLAFDKLKGRRTVGKIAFTIFTDEIKINSQ